MVSPPGEIHGSEWKRLKSVTRFTLSEPPASTGEGHLATTSPPPANAGGSLIRSACQNSRWRDKIYPSSATDENLRILNKLGKTTTDCYRSGDVSAMIRPLSELDSELMVLVVDDIEPDRQATEALIGEKV